jgi:hypothetical protein
VRTSCCAFGPYFRRELDFFFAPLDRPDREDDVRFARAPLERRELDFFAEERRDDDLAPELRDDDFFFAREFFEPLGRPFFFAGMNYSPIVCFLCQTTGNHEWLCAPCIPCVSIQYSLHVPPRTSR